MGPAANKRCGGRRHSHVFPHWVNHEMRVDKRFAGRPHACLPTVSQQCARLVRLTTSMRPNTNSLHCSRQPLKALWYLASICSRTSHDRCCNSASTFRRLSFSIAMTAKLLRLIALISSNSGINRSRSTTNVCTNLRSGAASRASRAPKPSPSAPPSAMCTTPATQNDGRCEVVPRLPRETKVDVTKCHACHAEVARRHGRHARLNPVQARQRKHVAGRQKKVLTTPATQNDGRCEVVPRLPRETKVDVCLCHTCHAEVARRHGRHARLNQVQARHPVPCVPRLPRKTTVDVRLCHACHVKRRWMSPSAMPATQKWRTVTGVTRA